MLGGNVSASNWGMGKGKRFRIENTEDEEIPPYAVCEIIEMKDRGAGLPYLRVKKMTADGAGSQSLWVFNTGGTIFKSSVTDHYGSGTRDFPCQVIYDATKTISPGDSLGPVEGEWHVSVDGTGLSVLAKDLAIGVDEDDVKSVWVVGTGGGSGDLKIYRMTSSWGGIAGAPVDSAEVDITNADGSGALTGKQLLDPLVLMRDQDVDDVGWCFEYGGKYYAVQAPCTGSTGGGGPVPYGGGLTPISESVYVPSL